MAAIEHTHHARGPSSLIWALAICAAIFSLPPAQGKQVDLNILKKLEQQLFFRTYDKEDLNSRVARIERQIFGDQMDGQLDERVDKLVPFIKPDAAPEQPAPGAIPARKPVPAASPSMPARPADLRSAAEERQYALERARTAAKAAREEEIQRLMAESVDLFRAGKGRESATKLEQVLRLDPGNGPAHYSMGVMKEAAGRLQEALVEYEQALEVMPDNKEYKQAVALLKRKAAGRAGAKPDSPEIKQLKASALAAFRRKEYISALDLYKQLDERVPDNAPTKHNIGTVYLLMKQPERALPYFKAAMRLDPKDARFADSYRQLSNVLKGEQSRLDREGKASAREEKRAAREASRRKEQPIVIQPTFTGQPLYTGQGQPMYPAPHTVPMQSTPSHELVLEEYGFMAAPARDGVRISAIKRASRAQNAGLQPGDVIRAVDGTPVRNINEFVQTMQRRRPGETLYLLIQRANDQNVMAI